MTRPVRPALSGGSRRRAVAGCALLLAAGPVVLAGTAQAASGQAGRVTAGVAALGPLVRTLNVLPGLDKAVSLGDAPAGTPLTIGIGLATTDPAGEQARFSSEYDPSSPLYHQFLTPAQFDDLYGAPKADTAAVTRWLTQGGLRIQMVSGAGDYITATGSTARIGALMHTTFGDYSVGGHRFVANRVGPAIPSGVDIDDVMGLNTLQQVYPGITSASGPTETPLPSVHAAATTSSYVGELTPQDLWGVYDMPASDEGQGEVSGIFGDGYFNTISADLRYFEAQHHLPQVPVKDVRTQGGPLSAYADNTGTVEWTLDSQALTGAAPKLSQLDLYFADAPLDADIAAAFMYWAGQKNAPTQMNASFGECEEDPTSKIVTSTPVSGLAYGAGVGNQLQLLGDAALEQASLEGRTLFAAAGDTAGACPLVVLPVIGAGNGILAQPDNEAGYPASSAYVTAVGGTVVTTNGTTADGTKDVHRVAEQSWVYSGGGTSYTSPEPAYQKRVKAIVYPCADPGASAPTSVETCRGAPDIADMSGTGTPDGELEGSNSYDMTYDYLNFGEGGTSLASPLAVGMWSRIQAAAPRNKNGTYNLGFANWTIYPDAVNSNGTYTKDYARDFYDITSDDVPSGALGNVTYRNATGWDYVSGFGAMNVGHLIQDVDHDPTMLPTHAAGQAAIVPARTCLASMTSPAGNASDTTDSVVYPYTNDAHQDLTSASLRNAATGKDLVVTMSGPSLAPSNPLDATGGTEYYVLWRDGAQVYGAGADVSQTGAVSYVTVQPNADPGYSVTHTLTSGSFTGGTLRVTVPLADVGAPAKGSELVNPFAVTEVPGAVFVTFALDQATPAEPGQALVVGDCEGTRLVTPTRS